MKRFVIVIATFTLFARIGLAQNYNAAVETFNQGSQIIVTDKLAALNLYKSALAQFKASKDAKASEMVTKCKEIIPQTLLSIAKDLIEANQINRAITTLKETVTVAGENGLDNLATEAKMLLANTLVKKGQNWMREKQYFEAILEYEKANSFWESGATYKLIAIANESINSINREYRDNAIDAYKKYLELTPDAEDASDVSLHIAKSLFEQGRTDEALVYATKSNSYEESAEANRLLSEIYSLMGDKDKAAEAKARVNAIEGKNDEVTESPQQLPIPRQVVEEVAETKAIAQEKIIPDDSLESISADGQPQSGFNDRKKDRKGPLYLTVGGMAGSLFSRNYVTAGFLGCVSYNTNLSNSIGFRTGIGYTMEKGALFEENSDEMKDPNAFHRKSVFVPLFFTFGAKDKPARKADFQAYAGPSLHYSFMAKGVYNDQYYEDLLADSDVLKPFNVRGGVGLMAGYSHFLLDLGASLGLTSGNLGSDWNIYLGISLIF